jgi:anti-sigma B factor antagonist
MLSDVRRAKESRVVKKKSLQLPLHLHANAQLTLVVLEHTKCLAVNAESWMAECNRLLRALERQTDLSQLLKDLVLGRHFLILAGYAKMFVHRSRGGQLGFSASTRQLGEVTVVDVRGRFTLIEGEAVHELLTDLFQEGRRRVLLNFRDVSYLDSSGIGQLVRGLYTARKNGAELRAVDLSPRAREILRMTNLHTVFRDFPDEQSAVSSFAS